MKKIILISSIISLVLTLFFGEILSLYSFGSYPTLLTSLYLLTMFVIINYLIIVGTYIYKEDTGQANMGFSYINAIGHGKSYKIFSSGSFDFTDGAFKAAKEFGAYDYVTIPGDDKKYSIEEFQSMFKMN